MRYALVLLVLLSFAAAAQAKPPHGEVCFNGQTISLVGRDAVEDFLENPKHKGASAGPCPTPVASGVPNLSHGMTAAYLCDSGGGLYIAAVADVKADLAHGDRYANEVLLTPGADKNGKAQPNMNGTGYFTCVTPSGVTRIPGVLADNNGWLYPEVLRDGQTIGYPAFR